MPQAVPLFSKVEFSALRNVQLESALRWARELDPDLVLASSDESLIAEGTELFALSAPLLDLDHAKQSGVRDVELPTASPVLEFGRVVPLRGKRVQLHIPFKGDYRLFEATPTVCDFNRPFGNVSQTHLLLTHEAPVAQFTPEAVKRSLDISTGRTMSYLDRLRLDCGGLRAALEQQLAQELRTRRDQILRDREVEQFLGVPVLRRADASSVLRPMPPESRRSVQVAKKRPKGFSPEPAISDSDYAAILEAIESFGLAAERFPSTFGGMPEPALREVLLVMLNNQFGPSGGEVFSRSGKTDIAIFGDASPVFFAECKFWTGPASVRKAINQLLGYLTWRDTKGAIVLFVRQQEVTAIAEKANAEMRNHPQCKRRGRDVSGSSLYVYHHAGDVAREIRIALVIVVVPHRTSPPNREAGELAG